MLTERQLEILRQEAQNPISQFWGLFGLNTAANKLAAYNRRRQDEKRTKTGQVVDSSLAGIDQILQQLAGSRDDLFSIASNQALGKGASVLRSVAGMGGIAGSGLQALGGAQLASNVLAQLSRDIAKNQLQRTQLQSGLLGTKAGLATGWQDLLLRDWKQQEEGQGDNNLIPKLLYSIARSFIAGGA